MGKQQTPYPLRMASEVMAKLKVVAKSHGRSVNKEIEIMAQENVAAYEEKNGPIIVEVSQSDQN